MYGVSVAAVGQLQTRCITSKNCQRKRCSLIRFAATSLEDGHLYTGRFQTYRQWHSESPSAVYTRFDVAVCSLHMDSDWRIV